MWSVGLTEHVGGWIACAEGLIPIGRHGGGVAAGEEMHLLWIGFNNTDNNYYYYRFYWTHLPHTL